MKSQNSNLIAVPWGPDVTNPVRNTNQLYLKFLNSGVFSEEGRRFLRQGYYTDAPKGTLDYKKYWEEQWNRCINGYTVGGVRITGRHYFYLNFCLIKARPVDPITGIENILARKKWTIPRFLDHSYYFFNELEECMAEGPHYEKSRLGLVVLKSRRKGFEQPNSEVVITPTGETTMGSIRPGDLVIGSNGRPTKVTSVYPQGVKDVYEMTLFDGRTVRCGENHLWEVFDTNDTRHVLSTKELLDRKLTLQYDNFKVYKYRLKVTKAIEYGEQNLPIPAYTLGALLGDGNVTKQLKLSGVDKEVLNNVISDLNSVTGNGEYYYMSSEYAANWQISFHTERGTYWRILYGNKYAPNINPVYEELKLLGLNTRAEHKYIPEQYKRSSVKQRMELVKGLMDTDGGITKTGSCSFSSVSKALVSDLQYVLYSLGVTSTMRQRKDGMFILYINSSEELFKISRKLERINKNTKHRNNIPIVSITKLQYREESTCISVDAEDCIYLTKGYIPTHNTYQISAGAFAYNFIFLPHSMSLLAAYEKAHYKVTLDGIHSVINHVNKHTPWVRRKEVLNQREHFRASFKEMNDNVEVEDGYLSEVHAVSFKDNPFKGIGECLAKGTGVMMCDGTFKHVEDICVGDYTMGVDSTPRKVLSVHNGTDKMYKVIPTKGEPFMVNSKHKHYLYDEYTRTHITKTTEELLHKTKWQHTRYKVCLSEGVEFAEQSVDIDAYMLGIWLGDGNSETFAITSMDSEIISAVYDTASIFNCNVRVANNGSKASLYHLNSESALRYTVSNKTETLRFSSLDGIAKHFKIDRNDVHRGRSIVKGGYTITKADTPNDVLNRYNLLHNKHVPDNYLYNTRRIRLELLAGIIDTDGCLVNNKSYYEIYQKDLRLAEQIVYLCRSLGFYTKISSKIKTNAGKVFSGYRITITGDIWNIPVRVTRKKALAIKTSVNSRLRTTFKIEECGIGEYYGFELDKDHLFIMDNFFVTHNSLDLAGFEEAGKFEGLLEALAITEPTYRDGDIMTGVPLVWGCVCAGTKVWTADGKEINIEELTKEDGVIGYAGVGAMQQPIIWQKPVAKKPCYRITTVGGKYIECSDDHPLLWSKLKYEKKVNGITRKIVEFKYAKDIKPGDQLMSVRQMPVFGNKRMRSPRIIGLLIGDGSYGSKSKVELAVGDNEIYLWLKENGIKTSIYKEWNTKNGKPYKSLGIKTIRPYLKELGIFGQTKENKHLPVNIHEYDLYTITELLGGYFDADGSVSYNSKKRSTRISLTSKYKHLLEEVKQLLFKLGIGCCIQEEQRKSGYKPGTIYRLYVTKKEDVRGFYKHIKLLCKHKQDAISKCVDDIPSDSVFDNCYFNYKEDNGKGEYLKNIDKCSGLQSNYVTSVEYIGEQDIYNMNAGITHTYISNGFISGNTGGDIEEGGAALGEFFYNPKAYGFKRYENIYDENATGECGWFVDDLWYLPGEAKIGGTKVYMVDSQGNSIRSAAYETLMKKRDDKKKGDPRSYKTFITQQPLTPKEALMRTDGDYFDVISAQDRISQIETNPKIYINTIHIGRMSTDDTGSVIWKPSSDLQPVREFPIRDNKNKPGAIEIFEHPVRNDSGDIPHGLYIAGIDPYDDDESTTTSLGSTLIMNLATDRIVAEYTGRPATAYQYYENVRRLLIYYNALAMYENAKKGLFTYFERTNCTYLLADTPKFLKDIELVKVMATGNSSKGYAPTTSVNAFGRGLIRNWSMQQATNHPDGVTNMLVTRSIGLLKEMANYSPKGNFDRISAMIALMLLREEIGRYVTPDILNAKVELKRNDPFFNKNYGVKSWQNQILFGKQ